jgi:very-short-patch-repair endonuclease
MATQTQSGRRERALAALADRQHGVVSRADLLAIGFKSGAIRRRIEARRLYRVHRGVYSVGRSTLNLRGRWLAGVLAYGHGAVLSHRSAALLWGLIGREAASVDVIASKGRAGRPGIFLHQCRLGEEDRTLHDAIPVTTPTRTLFDLSEVVDATRLTAACEEADRLGLLQMRKLERMVEHGWGRHALKPIRPIVAEARRHQDTRSPLEARFAEFCRERGLPPPVTNTSIMGHEVDALWPDRQLIVELDGFAFHAHRAAFERDRARDAALLVAGYRVIRITHKRLLAEPVTLESEIRKLLGRS